MQSWEFGHALMSALTVPHPQTPSFTLPSPGLLRLQNMVAPPGFSGGGAYVKVPAIALNPKAPRDAPGDPQLQNPELVEDANCLPSAFPSHTDMLCAQV
jgi:hypothetical protein